jgi:hypothetical protein
MLAIGVTIAVLAAAVVADDGSGGRKRVYCLALDTEAQPENDGDDVDDDG